MPHPMVDQLRFTRSEFLRCLSDVSPEDAVRRFQPMNCISWIIGHLAEQENRYWVAWAQGKTLHPELRDLVGFGRPATTPPLADMWAIWREVTAAADEWLETVTPEILLAKFENGRENIGTLFHRNIYHYWFHIGEAHAIRQQLGHGELPQFVGRVPPWE